MVSVLLLKEGSYFCYYVTLKLQQQILPWWPSSLYHVQHFTCGASCQHVSQHEVKYVLKSISQFLKVYHRHKQTLETEIKRCGCLLHKSQNVVWPLQASTGTFAFIYGRKEMKKCHTHTYLCKHGENTMWMWMLRNFVWGVSHCRACQKDKWPTDSWLDRHQQLAVVEVHCL